MNNTQRYPNGKEKSFMLVQGFYGNRTLVDIGEEDINKTLNCNSDTDRVVIEIPNTENLVLIYSKDKEERVRKDNEKGNFKPLAFIKEKDIEIYSRCIVCRQNSDGHFVSFEEEDFDKVTMYLAK